MKKTKITVETIISAEASKVWNCWTQPEHITKWNFASDDWHCPKASNDLKVGGKFSWTMASKDGKMSFDFEGIYNTIIEQKQIIYTLLDDRRVVIDFTDLGGKIKLTETFEAEEINTLELQKGGWQAILDNFKKHVESV